MSLNREYKVLLSNKLNQLWYQGYVSLERWEILSWYGKDRITAVVWRDILETWDGFIVGEASPKLGIIKCDDSTTPQKYVLINLDAVAPVEDLT